MKSSKVEATDGTEFIVQGFRGSAINAIDPYVFVGKIGEEGVLDVDTEFTPENAHILSEEIRKHAEFAATPRTEEEK